MKFLLPIFWILSILFAFLALIVWFSVITSTEFKSTNYDGYFYPINEKLGAGMGFTIASFVLILISSVVQYLTIFNPLRISEQE